MDERSALDKIFIPLSLRLRNTAKEVEERMSGRRKNVGTRDGGGSKKGHLGKTKPL